MAESVRLNCTDRGQHPRALLAEFVVPEGGRGPVSLRDAPSYRSAGSEGVFGRQVAHELRCYRCGRNPRIGEARLIELVAAAQTLGVRVLDISKLPF